jgi:transformation/transcription domain-associated protein
VNVVVFKVYVALLRAYQTDGKEVIGTALDILVPVLSVRLPPEDFSKAIKWTKKVLIEEAHVLLNIIHIMQLIVRHPDVFYSYRSQLLPQMIFSISRIGLPPTCTIENRLLAINICEVVIGWEWYRVNRRKLRLISSSASIVSSLKPSSIHHANDGMPNTVESTSNQLFDGNSA